MIRTQDGIYERKPHGLHVRSGEEQVKGGAEYLGEDIIKGQMQGCCRHRLLERGKVGKRPVVECMEKAGSR